MLDTNIRNLISPIFKSGAKFFINLKFTPNQVSTMALFFGVLSSILLYTDNFYLAIAILWFSGYLDAVDGEMARITNSSSYIGTLMDITFDRIVEISIIVVCALKYPHAIFSLLILSCNILLCMVVFLTVGSLTDKKSNKSFYYQPGLMERTEGFILFSLMILFGNYIVQISILFSILIFFTTIQRFYEGIKILK